MEFESSFDVDVPIDQVWDALLDLERVAPAVPGARVLERTSDDAYKVAIKVKVGPISMTYQGEVEITERDDAAHRAVMKARAKESRGQGTANADVTMVLTGDNGRTSATVKTDVELSGKVATMGQGVLRDVSGGSSSPSRRTWPSCSRVESHPKTGRRVPRSIATPPLSRAARPAAARAPTPTTPSTSARSAAHSSPTACGIRAGSGRCLQSSRPSSSCSAGRPGADGPPTSGATPFVTPPPEAATARARHPP